MSNNEPMMSNNEQLFAEIIPSEEASLSGGLGGRRRRTRRRIRRRIRRRVRGRDS